VTLPFLELLTEAEPGPPEGVVELLTVARSWCDPRAADRTFGRPAARFATSPTARGLAAALDEPIPVAVFVDGTRAVPDDVRERAAVLVACEPLQLQGETVVTLPRDSVDAAAHPPLSPFVRARRREAMDLPSPFVVALGCDPRTPLAPELETTALAVVSAAAVVGPRLLVALALGTPVVTTAAEAERVGAHDNAHVVVAPPQELLGAARDLAADDLRCARLGAQARRLVETTRDRRAIVQEILLRLGIGRRDPLAAPLSGIQAALDTLDTPPASPQAVRALGRVTSLTGARDWAELTGRRR
jgi:hypothetical protein